MRKYLATIIVVVLLIIDEIIGTLPSAISNGPLYYILLPLGTVITPVNMVLAFIVKCLPTGPWEILPNFLHGPLFDQPNFSGWVVASAIVLITTIVINYLLIRRK